MTTLILCKKVNRGKKRTLETELFYIGLVFLGLGAGVWGLYYFLLQDKIPHIPCIFDTVIGLYCPGCGGTRALVALLHGRIFQALWYHPLIPYAAVVGGGFMVTQAMERLGVLQVKGWKYHNWYLYVGMGLIALNFTLKNMLRVFWGILM